MKTHLGKEVTAQELQNAREHVADEIVANAKVMRHSDHYADHITEDQKANFLNEDLLRSHEVAAGKHDHAFWCWQRMNTFITGKCVAFFS